MNAPWIEEMRGTPVADVAAELGLTVNERRRWISPCPACGRERRNASTPGERRGAIGLPSDTSWHCFACESGGDAIDLVAVSIARTKFKALPQHHKNDVRAWCERFRGIDGHSPKRRTSKPPSPIERVEKPYPPIEEVSALLNRICVPVTEDAEVSAYLQSRRVDPVEVDDRRLAAALPARTQLPSWAHFGRHRWDEIGNRLLVPLYDSTGQLRSVVARRIVDGGTPKTLPPKGFGKAGLVMACPFARTILRVGGMPRWPSGEGTWWGADAPSLRILITEGDSDFLTAATGASQGVRWSDADEYAPAIIGITSGAWTAEIAARVPDHAELVIATDADDAGDKYANAILRTVSARIDAATLRASRWVPGSHAQ